MKFRSSKFNFPLVTLFIFVLLAGCTGFIRRSNGNAEGFAGARPVPGIYYAIHPNAACANSANAVSGHQAVIEVTSTGGITRRGACESASRDVAPSRLMVSQYGHEPYAGPGMLVDGDLIFDAKTTVPTIATAGPSTHAWVYQQLGAIHFDVILRYAEGPVETPVAKAQVFMTEIGSDGKKAIRLAAVFSVGGNSTDADHQSFTGENFILSLQRIERRAVGTLTATVDGKSVQLTSLKGYNTFFAPPPPAQARPAITLTGGNHFSCGTFNGSAHCWGINDAAQCGLGQASMTPVGTPTPITSLSSAVTSLSAGDTHACAIRAGKAYCWGSNSNYQIGSGANNSVAQLFPFEIPNSGATSVAAGAAHTCGIFAAKAYCWGQNIYGQLGTGDIISFNTPVAVINIAEDLASVSAGLGHTCALTVGGEAYCWGANTNGQLGRGTTGTYSATPQKISGARFVSIASNGDNSCGISIQGKVVCWGANYTAQVSGNGSALISSFASPQELSAVPEITTRIAMGAGFVCALQSGQPLCWGANQAGQLGMNNTTSPLPVSNVGLSDVYEIATGVAHTFAYGLGFASSWGDNSNFELGDGTNVPRILPGPFAFP